MKKFLFLTDQSGTQMWINVTDILCMVRPNPLTIPMGGLHVITINLPNQLVINVTDVIAKKIIKAMKDLDLILEDVPDVAIFPVGVTDENRN